MTFRVLVTDGDTCRWMKDRRGQVTEFTDAEAARAGARQRAGDDELPTRGYLVVAIHGQCAVVYDDQGHGGYKVVEHLR